MKPKISIGDRTLLAIAAIKSVYPALLIFHFKEVYFGQVRLNASYSYFMFQSGLIVVSTLLFVLSGAVLIHGASSGLIGKEMVSRHLFSKVLDGLAVLILLFVIMVMMIRIISGIAGESLTYFFLLFSLFNLPQLILAACNFLGLDSETIGNAQGTRPSAAPAAHLDS